MHISHFRCTFLLHISHKNAHFSLNSKAYVQIHDIVMGSPLVPVLASIFVVELEQFIIPTLSKYISLWKRYVDYVYDTICFRNSNCISHIQNKIAF